jgi:hypothetical protein
MRDPDLVEKPLSELVDFEPEKFGYAALER